MDTSSPGAGITRTILANSIRYWELRRVTYNVLLAAIVVAWVVLSWPHFRPAMSVQSAGILLVLALLANVCYTAAYLVDLPLQASALQGAWRRWRWGLWVLGMLLAILLENYWIADEIYPYVNQ